MEKQEKNTANEKQKRFLLMVPVLIFPFLTLGFWALGGGKGKAEEPQETAQGFNPELPTAHLDEKDLDKLAYYEQASKDSTRKRDAAKGDPYYSFDDMDDDHEYAANPYSFREYDAYSPEEQRVYQKLDQLNAVLEQSSGQDNYEPQPAHAYNAAEQQHLRDDIDRLEKMMLMMQGNSGNPDPEMEQINSVLESVLDLQHPERVQERLRQSSMENRGMVYAVSSKRHDDPVSLLDNRSVQDYADAFNDDPGRRENRFFGLDDGMASQDEGNQAIEAAVHETQTLVSGSTVKLRLLHDVYINGRRIPKDNFIYGIANLNGERLEISIENVRHDNHLLAVQLAVHDLDGLPGIQVPGAITRDAAKQSGDRAIQGVNMGMFNPGIGAQAASAGIELGRNLLSRKIKLVKVEVKAGYRVLLKDNKRKDY